MKDLNVLIQEILERDDFVCEKDRYMMYPSASDVSEWENSSAGIDTNK